MSWLDFIGNIGNKIKYANAPQIPALQMAENGGLDAQKTLELALAQPKTLGERLGGRTVNVDFENSNPETGEIEVNRISKYQPGLLNDIRSGAKENFATGFAAPNWEQTVTPDGRKKGLGYRLGEGLGSFARFAESPLGRGLLMAGIVGASGGSGLEALGYGAGAGLGNQQARMKDRLYRNNLIERAQTSLRNRSEFKELDPIEQQRQLDEIANKINSIRGYVGDNTYKPLLEGMQLQDNAEYRNALLAGQRKDQEMVIQQRQAELRQKTLSDAADRALKNRELDIQEMKALNGNSKEEAKRKQSQSTLNMIGTALNTVDQNPEAYGFWKGMAPNDITNRADAKGVQARAVIDSVTAEYRKYLTGAQMSDKERKDYEKFLPNPRDNADIIRRKLQGMQTVIQAREGLYDYAPQAQVGNTTKSGVKYEVID